MKPCLQTFLPLARRHGIISKEIDGEVLVYDRTSDQAHCLNETAAAIWKRCDGRTTPAQIAASLSTEIVGGLVNEHLIWLGLKQLQRVHLLSDATGLPDTILVTRREVVRRIGLGAAIALPVILSITAPRSAEAGTCKHANSTCATGSECCSGVCDPGSPPKCLGG